MDLTPTLPTKSPSRAQQQRKPQEQPLTPEVCNSYPRRDTVLTSSQHPVPDYRTSHYDALPSSITASALPHKDRATILRRKKEQLLHLLNQRETMGQKVQQLSKQLRALPKQIGNVQTDIDAMEAVESDANGAEVMTESEDEDWLFAPRGQKSSDVLRQLEMS